MSWGDTPDKPSQPVGAIMFAHGIGIRRLAERDFDIVRWTDVWDHGGHFAAMENPRELAEDLRQLVHTASGTDHQTGSL